MNVGLWSEAYRTSLFTEDLGKKQEVIALSSAKKGYLGKFCKNVCLLTRLMLLHKCINVFRSNVLLWFYASLICT